MTTKNKGPVAHRFTDGDGFFTERCKTKEQAKAAMEEWFKNDPEYEGFEIKLEDIHEEVAYYHRKCGYTSLGENICGECGEPTRGNGRLTFAYYFL